MLAVSPPLHQDFRAGHTRFCSPGDGWPAYIPPPPPTVSPAFHFCSLLLDPDAYALAGGAFGAPKRGKPRPPLDKRLHGACVGALSLPPEILDDIIARAIDDGVTGPSVARASRRLHNVAIPHLYRAVRLHTAKSVTVFADTLEAHPERAAHVRALHLETHRLPWPTMERIASSLQRGRRVPGDCLELVEQPRQLEALSLQIQASDLHLAIPFLAALSPRTFSWRTSPCWLMRPAHPYASFLSKWPHLQVLHLEGFRFDEALLQCLSVVPSLETLHLGGRGCAYIDAPLLRAVLDEPPRVHAIDKMPRRVVVKDCSPARRHALEEEMRHGVLASCGAGPFDHPFLHANPTDDNSLARLNWV